MSQNHSMSSDLTQSYMNVAGSASSKGNIHRALLDAPNKTKSPLVLHGKPDLDSQPPQNKRQRKDPPQTQHDDRILAPSQNIYWQEKLEEWQRKKNIRCPNCDKSLFGYSTTLSTVELTSMEANVLRVFHTACQSKTKGKSLYICLDCGAMSSYSTKKLIASHCKCLQQKKMTLQALMTLL